MDITINGPKGSGKTKLATQIWGMLEGKRSLVQVHKFQPNGERQAKTWDSVNADVIIFDGCVCTLMDRMRAHDFMKHYRETYNPTAIAIYITDGNV